MKRGLAELDNNLLQIPFPVDPQAAAVVSLSSGSSASPSSSSSAGFQKVFQECQLLRKQKLQQLKKIQELEHMIDQRILQEKRIQLPLKADVSSVQKVLRLFIRHVYVPIPTETLPTSFSIPDSFSSPGGGSSSGSVMTKGHFLLWIEGITFREGNSSVFTHGLQNVFDRIYIEVDKGRYDYNVFNYDWKESDFPQGSKAQSIRVKIPCDKNCSARIQLFLRNDAPNHTRYQIKTERLLTLLLPQLPTGEGTEEEICLALINYIAMNNLFSDRDHRYCRCDEALREIFGLDSLAISNLRSRLLGHHLMLPYPIQFDHQFSTSNTEESIQATMRANSRLPAALLYPKIGGRVIDLPLSMPESGSSSNTSRAHRYLYEMNRLAQKELDEAVLQRQLVAKSQYLCREILEYDSLVNDLLALYEDSRGLVEGIQEIAAATDNGKQIASSSASSSSSRFLEYLSRKRRKLLPGASIEDRDSYLNQYPQPPTPYDLIAGRYSQKEDNGTRGRRHQGGATPAAAAAASEEKKASSSSSFRFSRPIRTIDSALHTLGGFLDVGNSELFEPTQPWLVELGRLTTMASSSSSSSSANHTAASSTGHMTSQQDVSNNPSYPK